MLTVAFGVPVPLRRLLSVSSRPPIPRPSHYLGVFLVNTMAASAETLISDHPKLVEDDWTIVFPRRKNQKTKLPKLKSAKQQQEQTHWTPTDLETTPERELKLMQKMQICIEKLEKSQLLKAYDFNQYIHPKVRMSLNCFHTYFMLEIVLAMVAYVAQTVGQMELEPQFDEPYLATSLQDFWGKRWNLMVTSILHPTVYDPVHTISSRLMSRKRASLVAVFTTFLVSGSSSFISKSRGKI
ncbi:hypothetical protein L1987_14485 [Smallanthus sonchifolius]|uniref:Uncharacterized protein n=1 Tax=Smallanthus sonchifolius TaxID=185202 RepID=A0ACB9J2V5_9ASTR|nr:hypothetical protein L1987_14485 [Smallanthus sonchifolius]